MIVLRIHRLLDVVFIEVVTLEQLLDAVSSQLSLAVIDGLRVLPLLVVHVVLVEVVNVYVWHVLRLDSPISESIPVKVIKPWVCLELISAVFVADALGGFSLDALVYKVSCFLVPPVWDVVLLDLDLAT